MAGSLPKARKRGGPDRRLIVLLASVVLGLTALLVYLLVGGALFGEQPRTDAERDYSLLLEAARKNPNDAATLMSLAEAEYDLGKRDAAMEHAERAIKNSKKAPYFNLRHATLLVQEDRLAEAVKALEAEIAITQTTEAEPYFLLAQVQADQKDYDAAIVTMEKGLAIDPMAADIRIAYADILERAGKKDEAVDQLKQALKFLPGDERAVDALERLGVTYEATTTVDPHSTEASEAK